MHMHFIVLVVAAFGRASDEGALGAGRGNGGHASSSNARGSVSVVIPV